MYLRVHEKSLANKSKPFLAEDTAHEDLLLYYIQQAAGDEAHPAHPSSVSLYCWGTCLWLSIVNFNRSSQRIVTKMTRTEELRVTEDGRIYSSGRRSYPNGDSYSVRNTVPLVHASWCPRGTLLGGLEAPAAA